MQDVPYGYCHCGCGRKTTVQKFSRRKQGLIKGEPARFIVGHAGNLAQRTTTWYVVDEQGCWIWQGGQAGRGYGKRNGPKVRQVAHRWMYERLVGPIPDGMTLDHLCLNKLYVNPQHLEVVTMTENNRRRSTNKLTQAKADEIRSLAGTMLQRDIAERYGVYKDSVQKVLSNKTWVCE
jgi:hypothetical protein